MMKNKEIASLGLYRKEIILFEGDDFCLFFPQDYFSH